MTKSPDTKVACAQTSSSALSVRVGENSGGGDDIVISAEEQQSWAKETDLDTNPSDAGVPDEGVGRASSNDDYPAGEASSIANDDEPNGDDLAEHRRATESSQRRRARGGGKRKLGGDTADDEGDATASDLGRLLLLSEFKNSPHHLRIPASSVSALCGLHPFQDLPKLLFDLVYQSRLGQWLLQNDARALGLALVDARERERETMLSLASAASNETRELVEQVLEVSGGTKRLESIEEVRSIQDRIKSRAIEAREDGRLSARQVKSLIESSRGHVSTGFGTCHEDDALDLYESRIGCCVRERNEALVEWRFRRVCDVDGELGVTATPIGEAIRRGWKRPSGVTGNDDGKKAAGREETMHVRPPEVPIEIDCDEKSGIIISNEEHEKRAANGVVSSPLAMDEESLKPFFRIVGAVDGIRDELYMDSSKPPAGTSQDKPPASAASSSISNNQENASKQQDATNIECSFSDDEEDNWTLRPIIVECKHRMNEAKVPPPLYDQIQTCLYCHMYNVEDADLVQVVRRKNKPKKKENDALRNETEDEKVGNGKCRTRSTTEETNITITRVSLSDPIYNHNHHWHATLLPRLASFADAVYNVRKDDGKRYRLLMAQSEDVSDDAEEDSWRLLWEECPWLRHCDTAFANRRRF